MPARVLAAMWGERVNDAANSPSAQLIEYQTHDKIRDALARDTPGAFEIRSCVYSWERALNDEPLQGYLVLVVVSVRLESLSLVERLALGQQVQDTLTRTLALLFDQVLVEYLEVQLEQRGSPERRG